MTIKTQQALVKFLMKYPERWHSFSADRDTVEAVCATSNLGILTVKGDQMILKSREKAHQYLYNR